MWLLHAGHADRVGRPHRPQPEGHARGDPRASLGQFLPLHRLSRHRRRGRIRRPRKGREEAMSLSPLDRPNSYIGRSVPRPTARKLAEGRGQYTDDIKLPRMAHVAFLRSPYAHARILRIDTQAAAKSPG